MIPLLASIALLVAPPAPAYVVLESQYAVACAGKDSAAQTAAAASCPGFSLALWRRSCFSTMARPSWLKARSVAELEAALKASPALSIRGEIQGGYVRETQGGGGLAVVGDAAYPIAVRYVSERWYYPCPSSAYANSVVDGIYSGGRLTLEERAGLLETYREPTPETRAIRARIARLAWGYLDSVRQLGPRVVTISPPKDPAPGRYDAAVADPAPTTTGVDAP